MRITVVDRNLDVVQAVASRGIGAECRSIIGFDCDAVVSPANSFGFMDGGVDYAYSEHFGWHVQAAVQAEIDKLPFSELLVGQALVVPTGNAETPWLVCAPTMRVPKLIQDAFDLTLATRAAVKAALEAGISHLAIPGMGTGCGRVPPHIAAAAMAKGIDYALNPQPRPASWQHAQMIHFGG